MLGERQIFSSKSSKKQYLKNLSFRVCSEDGQSAEIYYHTVKSCFFGGNIKFMGLQYPKTFQIWSQILERAPKGFLKTIFGHIFCQGRV